MDQPCFYSYTYPTTEQFRKSSVQPPGASFNARLGEFLLPYEAVRTAADPAAALLSFLQLTYQAAARAANWDASLECAPGKPRVPRRA